MPFVIINHIAGEEKASLHVICLRSSIPQSFLVFFSSIIWTDRRYHLTHQLCLNHYSIAVLKGSTGFPLYLNKGKCHSTDNCQSIFHFSDFSSFVKRCWTKAFITKYPSNHCLKKAIFILSRMHSFLHYKIFFKASRVL